MKQFFTLLITLFVACSTDPEPLPKEFEPYRIGTWYVDSPEHADWEGVKGKNFVMQGDSVVLTSPEQHSLEIEKYTDGGHDNGFRIIFRDSTTTKSDSVDIFKSKLLFTFGDDRAFTRGGNSQAVTDEVYFFRIIMQYFCSEDADPDTEIGIRLFKNDSTIYKTYFIESQGIVPVLDSLICN